MRTNRVSLFSLRGQKTWEREFAIFSWEREFAQAKPFHEHLFAHGQNVPRPILYLRTRVWYLHVSRETVGGAVAPPRTRVCLVVLTLCPADANTLEIRVPHTVRDGFQLRGSFAETNTAHQIRDYCTHQYLVVRIVRHVPQHAQEVVDSILTVGGSGGGFSNGENISDGLEISGHGRFLSLGVPVTVIV